MKILLTGKNGQVGFELRRSLATLGDVRAIDVDDCDLSNVEEIRTLIQNHQPDVIVNAAAYTAVDRAENDKSLAKAINLTAPQVLAEEAERLGAILVHYSTDYVFDGTKTGAYTEADLENPQNIYGHTKWQGELAVKSSCTRHLILRTSWVVGAHGGNFAKTMLRLAAERDSLSVVADQFGAPTSAALLADLTACLVRQSNQSPHDFPYGLYHAVASGVTNWHEYACHVIDRARSAGKTCRISQDSIRAITTADYPTPAKRPSNSMLDTNKLRQTFGFHLPNWQEGVDHILDQIL